MIDILLLVVLAGVTWLVSTDGPWGATITFVSVVLGGMLALNFFEPLAAFLSRNVLTSWQWQNRWDIIAFYLVFAGVVSALRFIGEKLIPTESPFAPLTYEMIRWGFALGTGYVTIAVVCTSLHLAPLQREFLGFTAERDNFFGLAPDRQLLGLTQYASESSLRTSLPDGSPAIFDGAASQRIPGQVGTEQIWSSFPIKYAARREQFASGAGGGAGGGGLSPSGIAPPPSSSGQPTSPSSGTGGF